MPTPSLHETAAALVAPGRGILAADESIRTMSQRLEQAGVAATEENRRAYRELLLTAPGLADTITGIILCDETLRQKVRSGETFPAAAAARVVHAGIKVDMGTTPLPFTDGGVVTQGLDRLAERFAEYRELGATFAKWRAVLAPAGLSPRTVRANAHALARYAALAQEAGIVPIVEPEVLMDGAHAIALCQSATADVLDAVFTALAEAGVDPAGIVLKPNMVISGRAHPRQDDPEEVARRTVHVLRESVPAQIPGIAFLSGGQSNAQACANLTAINTHAAEVDAPWRLTFSFGRALVDDALKTWRGDAGNLAAAQRALVENCRRAGAAARRPSQLHATV